MSRLLSIVAMALALLGCAGPERAAREPRSANEPRGSSTLIGVARGGKAGPAVIVDGSPVYVAGLDAWPSGWVGKEVVVTGRIATRRGLPEGTTMGGIVGPYRVIERASFRLASDAAHRPALVFEYSASDGEHGYGFELYDDRTWRRSEHSGTVPPHGRLSRAAMRRFEALLRAAPFVLEPHACADDPRWWAEITDASSDRHVRTEQCFGADETTQRLLNCLEVLADRGDFRDACRIE